MSATGSSLRSPRSVRKAWTSTTPPESTPSRGCRGDYTGLQLVSFLYTGMQLIDPTMDTGVDFSQEYKAAIDILGSS